MTGNVRSTCLFVAAATFLFLLPALKAQDSSVPQRWTEDKASLLVCCAAVAGGSNFLPSNAINELEMWQADTFDPATIDRELGWAEGIGMNTMRCFCTTYRGSRTPRDFSSASMPFS